MRKRMFAASMIVLFTVVTTGDAFARMGGGRSFGSRGSRSMSAPSRPFPSPGGSNPSTSTPSSSPNRQGASPQAPLGGGGFLRSLGAGMMGGFLGSMLAGSSGCGSRPGRQEVDPYATDSSGEGTSGGGIGFLEILLLAMAAFLLFRFLKKRRMLQEQRQDPMNSPPPLSGLEPAPSSPPCPHPGDGNGGTDPREGIRQIRQMDPSFDEKTFGEQATDLFFRLQGAWTRRDPASIRDMLTGEMRGQMEADIDGLKKKGQVNRLENIAVRTVEIAEAWQEDGVDYVTVRFLASLLDYTTDEAGKVLSGSDAAPVKFEEYWTLTRPVGPGSWKLAAIQQP